MKKIEQVKKWAHKLSQDLKFIFNENTNLITRE